MILGGYCRRSSDILDFDDDPPIRLHLAQGDHLPGALENSEAVGAHMRAVFRSFDLSVDEEMMR